MAPPLQHHSLDLAGSREQRGSAFELYRKPQLGNVPVHHHNIRYYSNIIKSCMYKGEEKKTRKRRKKNNIF